MNHSCDPNVECRSDKSTFAMLHVYALHSIRKGDEICIDYVGVANDNVANRKKKIREMYAFECNCDKCKAELQ